jgi:GT2 family glycosyltransferase
LLADSSPGLEVLVLDQSDDHASDQALASIGDPRLRYIRSNARGKGAALNHGLRLATGDVVVCTDDDCEVQTGWAAGMTNILAAHPDVAVLFCNVTGGEYDRTVGYVPGFDRRRDRLLRSVRDARNGLGLGAGMAIRRQVVFDIGGFDEMFGPGARFLSGDDWDISLRTLLMGWHVYETADLSVLHHGFRSFEEGRRHAFRDFIAIGALCAKPIRAGRYQCVFLAMWMFSAQALWPLLRDLFCFRRPSGVARILGFMKGFGQGIRTPVDRKTIVFRPAR